MSYLAESDVENTALEWFAGLGYAVLHGPNIAPDGAAQERVSYDQPLLEGRLRAALERLNPHLPPAALEEALRRLQQSETPSLVEENRRLHGFLVEGVPVETRRKDGSLGGDAVRLLDYERADANDWLAVNQYTMIENGNNRRLDVVVFVNGMPLAVIELKNPGDEHATLESAFNQLRTYRDQAPSLFRTNAALVISDGVTARIGSLTAPRERFMPWRTVAGEEPVPGAAPELETLVSGVFEKSRFLALVRGFTVFADKDSGPARILAGYHQFFAVRRAVESTVRASAPDGDRRVGVIWHTQGSGKSLLMVFYAGQVIRCPAMENPTIVVLTDRNDLDSQLFATFSACRDLLRQTPHQAQDREDLRQRLSRPSGGVIFTTIQKFAPAADAADYPAMTDRRNVVVIADEAHRSQYGFRANVDHRTGRVSYGFAGYLREALPGASFIGFTGTPIEHDDANTPAVFGDYLDVYDINRAVEDEITVPIYYESRLVRIDLSETEMPRLDEDIARVMEGDVEVAGAGDHPEAAASQGVEYEPPPYQEDGAGQAELAEEEQERLTRKWTRVEAVVGAEKRLAMIAEDLVQHFEDRLAGMDGKAMVVCMSRRICVALYEQITKLRPGWHSDDDNAGEIKVVMTGAPSDPAEWQAHVGGKGRRELLARRIRDHEDPLRLALVRDMWLTGFDAPCVHTMYVDKYMGGHNLMQAIARVNRVHQDKPGGLIVDYIGIAQKLKSALGEYSHADRQHAGIDEAEAVRVLQEKYETVCAMFHGFDYQAALSGSPQERLATLAEAMEWILAMQRRDTAAAESAADKKRARRRFDDAVLALSKAFALAAASDLARQIRDEVGFFQAVRAALAKTRMMADAATAEQEFAIQQLVSRAVISTDIVDILNADGLKTPNVSILSDEFLAEVRDMEKKNLALAVLHKLLNDAIRSRSQENVAQSQAFSERLRESVARYYLNAATAAEVIQELINLAKDIRAAHQRGEEEGLSQEEIAFYDALAQNESAVEVMGNEQLCVIAQELLNSLKANVPVDWQHREAARAEMRVRVKRILKKHGYPPDLQDAAVQTVLQQAEALAARWAA